MAFLSIDGTPVKVQVGATSQIARIGALERSFSGVPRSDEQTVGEEISFETEGLTYAALVTLRAKDDGALHTISGTIFNAASFSAFVRVTEKLFKPVGSTSHQQFARITLVI